jgi:hypothetical protein
MMLVVFCRLVLFIQQTFCNGAYRMVFRRELDLGRELVSEARFPRTSNHFLLC